MCSRNKQILGFKLHWKTTVNVYFKLISYKSSTPFLSTSVISLTILCYIKQRPLTSSMSHPCVDHNQIETKAAATTARGPAPSRFTNSLPNTATIPPPSSIRIRSGTTNGCKIVHRLCFIVHHLCSQFYIFFASYLSI